MLGIVPRIWVDIHERGGMYRDRGGASGATVCRGMTREEIRRRFPWMDVPAAITEDGCWHRVYEDISTCGGRAIKVASEMMEMAGVDCASILG